MYKLIKGLTAIALLAIGSSASATIITATFDEVNGDFHGNGFPIPEVFHDTETFGIPVGETIVSATLSGVWGQTSTYQGSTAHTELYLDGLLMSDTMALSPSPFNNIVPFLFTFTDFSILTDGISTLSYIQTSGSIVRLSETVLTIETTAIPEPGSLVLLGLGFAAMGIARRKFA